MAVPSLLCQLQPCCWVKAGTGAGEKAQGVRTGCSCLVPSTHMAVYNLAFNPMRSDSLFWSLQHQAQTYTLSFKKKKNP